jgi:hypothetical protein
MTAAGWRGSPPEFIPPPCDLQDGRRVRHGLDDAAGHEQVRPLLPGTAGSLVLITIAGSSTSRTVKGFVVSEKNGAWGRAIEVPGVEFRSGTAGALVADLLPGRPGWPGPCRIWVARLVVRLRARWRA